MNKKQIRKFALNVESQIKKDVVSILNRPIEVKYALFKEMYFNQGQYLPEVNRLFISDVNLKAHFKSVFGKLPLSYFKRSCNNVTEVSEDGKAKNFEGSDPVIQSFIWATNFEFCRSWSQRHECILIELIDDYANCIFKIIPILRYQFDRFFYPYFVNKVIQEYPELIINYKV